MKKCKMRKPVPVVLDISQQARGMYYNPAWDELKDKLEARVIRYKTISDEHRWGTADSRIFNKAYDIETDTREAAMILRDLYHKAMVFRLTWNEFIAQYRRLKRLRLPRIVSCHDLHQWLSVVSHGPLPRVA